MKEFNTTAICVPSKHYMVDISDKVAEISKLVDSGKYFTINRARQYGKTTTLTLLKKSLAQKYFVISISFEGITEVNFENERSFVTAFSRLIERNNTLFQSLPEQTKTEFKNYIAGSSEGTGLMNELFLTFNNLCKISDKPVVLIIDEVDRASNYQVFIDFLGLLRNDYIGRDTDDIPAFQSVILAGVTDIKHIKAKIRPDDNIRENSPWNIAADFTVDMSLPEAGIKGMLDEYEADHHTGMDTSDLAHRIHDHTSGYPFLVSRICQIIDTRLCSELSPSEAWSYTGFTEAIKRLLSEDNTLFQSVTAKLNTFPDLKENLHCLLMEGLSLPYNPQNYSVSLMQMYGFIKNDNSTVKISNRIFETLLYNLFITEEKLNRNAFFRKGESERNIFVKDGRLDMKTILEHFISTYNEVFGPLTDKFKEKDGRELFLLYLKPIINGTGNYYIEAQTRDQRRMDIVVDYFGNRYIIELKIWHGERYNEAGEQQICEYLDYFGLTTGYMLSFNFNQNKVQGIKEVSVGSKLLIEATL